MYPGLALAKALQKIKNDIDILYIGTTNGLEATIVPQAGLNFKVVDARGLPRKPSVKALATFFSAGRGTIEAAGILKNFQPDVVIGMGAYVSMPVVGAAVLRKIPTIIHEQNAVPGLVNRVLGKVVSAIAVSYPGMESHFPTGKRIVFTGNPIREEVMRVDRQEAARAYSIEESRKVVLIFGGSRGAQKINESAVGLYDHWRHNDGLQIIHSTGKINYDPVRESIDALRSAGDSLAYSTYPYIDDMGGAYAVADLLVCRSGATTIAEISSIGLPAILIPYPYATDNHQAENARQLERMGAAKVILDQDVTSDSLCGAAEELVFDKEKLAAMSAASLEFGRPRAAGELADLVFEVAQSKKNEQPIENKLGSSY